MNATAYINNAHKALSRNPGGLTLEELSGKLRAKALKVSQQIRELHDAGLIETTEDAGQPVYRLIAAPAAESAESVAEKTAESGPSNINAVRDASLIDEGKTAAAGDSEGGETDAPAVDAQREEFTLLGLLADIRAAAGDPDGRLMQDELVQHIAGVVKERDDLRERLDAQIKQWQTDTGRLAADLRAAMESRSQAINEAGRLRAELATERQAREALQEAINVVDAEFVALPINAKEYVLKSPWRNFRKQSTAKSAATAEARRGKRTKVFALVPIGEAIPGAEWRGQ